MNERLLTFAKTMRRNPTDAEALMWRRLRGTRLLEFKFKRQQPIGGYIVDFVCFERRLVIEIDGGQHADDVEADRARSNWLESEGFRVLRFWNNEVLQSTDDVLESIVRALDENLSVQASSSEGRGVPEA
jgi:very-short-patch-repair endonuclease